MFSVLAESVAQNSKLHLLQDSHSTIVFGVCDQVVRAVS